MNLLDLYQSMLMDCPKCDCVLHFLSDDETYHCQSCGRFWTFSELHHINYAPLAGDDDEELPEHPPGHGEDVPVVH